ncbi:hypothetical protein F4678DRAFT_458550 [Xylaria arbuscula]|nr:hypothetical protein F4678DRAFT_458550 [Xylaria arbuscula]
MIFPPVVHSWPSLTTGLHKAWIIRVFLTYSNRATSKPLFLCIGRTVFWTGVVTLNTVVVPIAAHSANQFATWVYNKVKGEPAAVETKRDLTEKLAEKWFEDEETVTYGWKPILTARDNDTLHIYNMTATYDKGSGSMTQAEITFDGENSSVSHVVKRDRVPITITYYTVTGHEETILSYSDLFNLFLEIFILSPDNVGSECGYASNTGAWHGAFKATISGSPDAGPCVAERRV